jgi:hypothetical protein
MEVREKYLPERKRKHHEINTSSGNYNFERSGGWNAVGPRGKRLCYGATAVGYLCHGTTHAGF